MKYPTVFFMGLTGIRLPYSSVPGLKLRGTLRAISDESDIQRLIGSYQSHIGKVEAIFLRYSANAVVSSRVDLDIDKTDLAKTLNGALIRALGELQAWIFTLWLIKDNAVNTDTAWMGVLIAGEIEVSNNRWSLQVSKADGGFNITNFSAEEIRTADEMGVPAEDMLEDLIELDISLRTESPSTKLSSKSLRFQRFMYFIGAARTTRDVAIKVAHYCSGLEAMVSSSQSELSHQVAERTACLLEMEGDARIGVFRIVKQGYGYRSKAVHGASFKPSDMDQLRQISVKLDAVLRKVALKYIFDMEYRAVSEAKNDAFENFWLHRIFPNAELMASEK